MDTDAAEKKVGVGREPQETENTEHPETAYDLNESDADYNPKPVGNQQNHDRQNSQEVDDAVNIDQLTQAISRAI